jgi:hypothetical protein
MVGIFNLVENTKILAHDLEELSLSNTRTERENYFGHNKLADLTNTQCHLYLIIENKAEHLGGYQDNVQMLFQVKNTSLLQ